MLNLGDTTKPVELIAERYGKKSLRVAYKENLRYVLQTVSHLVKNLTGKIVITADHGELLGEEGFYQHPPGWSHPLLRIVPWLVIEKN